MNCKYVVTGTGSLAVKIAEYLSDNGIVPLVYEKPYTSHSTVQSLCEAKNIAYEKFTSQELTERLLSILSEKPVKVISAINTYIFPKEVVENPNFSGINYHNALLPHHRGMNAEAWSIFSMDKTTGITWHEIAASVDKGGIIAQREIPLDDKITSFKLLNIQLEAAYKAFTEFAPDFINGKLKITPQDKQSSEFHYIKDVPNNGIINSEWSMDKISAFLRAMDYGMFYTLGKPVLEYNGKRYSCGRYKISETSEVVSDDVILMDNNTVTIKKQGSNIIVKLLNIKEISE